MDNMLWLCHDYHNIPYKGPDHMERYIAMHTAMYHIAGKFGWEEVWQIW